MVIQVAILADVVQITLQSVVAAVEQGPDLPQLQQQVQAAFDKLEAVQRQYGADFHTAETFDKLRSLHAPLQTQPTAGSPDETFERQDAYVSALLTLVREITDGSGLILDPEGDTYHMVAFSLVRGPRQYENTSRLLTLGHLALTSQQLTAERRTRIDEWQTMQQYLDDARQRFEAASEWSDVGPDPGQTSDEFEHLRWFDLPAPSLRR